MKQLKSRTNKSNVLWTHKLPNFGTMNFKVISCYKIVEYKDDIKCTNLPFIDNFVSQIFSRLTASRQNKKFINKRDICLKQHRRI